MSRVETMPSSRDEISSPWLVTAHPAASVTDAPTIIKSFPFSLIETTAGLILPLVTRLLVSDAGEKPVMKISMNHEAAVATLMVEGRVVGPWATELARTWRDVWAPARQKPLRLNICGVTFADHKGSEIFREIVQVTGAEIVADSPLTQYFASRPAETVIDPEEK